MTSWIGKSIAHYRVTAQIGAGGMGEVYRASDSRLGRDVAIKVLPAEFARDPERMARFEREAQLLAALSHANIASIFGLEEIDGSRALVMELVEGPTLADRIAGGALTPEEALPIAKQIADALEYAHERAIIHRDLKPANVKLTPDGTVKLLDFGLAKALSDDPAGSGSDLSKSPTLTAASTRLGVILGTAAYMSPEQAKGRAVDRRADIWSFGAVLFEMLAGRQAFAGETVSETLASVMKDEPDWNALPASTPTRVRDLLRRCLVKDPKQRLRDMGDARIRIEEEISGKPDATVATAARSSMRRGVPWLVAGLMVLAAAVVGVWGSRLAQTPAKKALLRASISFSDGMKLDNDDIAFAISPDGKSLAIAAAARGEPQRLWIRRLDRPDPVRIDGTDNASYPFWSPDSRHIGFFADRKLKRVPADGGVVQTVCDAIEGRGATWGRDDTIVFSPSPLSGLERVSATGGLPESITTLDSVGTTHRLPEFLPDTKHVLFVVGGNDITRGRVECVDLTNKRRTRVFSTGSQVRVIDSGHVAFVSDDKLMVQRFNPSTLKLEGQPHPLAQDIQVNPYRWAADFDVSATGMTVWWPRIGSQLSQPTWFDLDGRELGKIGEPIPAIMIALSSDGRRLLTGEQTDRYDMWMVDVATGVRNRVTFGETAAFPIWSPDMRTVYFGDGVGTVWARPSDGAGQARVVYQQSIGLWPGQATPDGKDLLCFVQRPTSAVDIVVIPVSGNGEMRNLIDSPGNQGEVSLSRDGKWLAYDTDESGRDEVVVVRYPSLTGRWQVTNQGGTRPYWLPDQSGILFMTADRHLMRVNVDTRGEGLAVGTTTQVFGGNVLSGPWIVAPDGKRLLVLVPQGVGAAPTLDVVTDWRQLVDD